MFKLYEIANEYVEALENMTADAELDEECIKDTLDSIQQFGTQKALNIAAYIKNLEVEADAVKESEKQMRIRRERLEKKIENIENYLIGNLNSLNIKEAKSDKLIVKIQKNPDSVYIKDQIEIPKDYLVYITATRPDRVLMKKALKNGVQIPGVQLISSYRIKINGY